MKRLPTKLELALLKWVFLPLFVLWTVFRLANVSTREARCASLCAEKGFDGHVYKPRRYSIAGECRCYTQEEIREGEARHGPPVGGRGF